MFSGHAANYFMGLNVQRVSFFLLLHGAFHMGTCVYFKEYL